MTAGNVDDADCEDRVTDIAQNIVLARIILSDKTFPGTTGRHGGTATYNDRLYPLATGTGVM